MPWREVCPMDEKLGFIGALVAQEERMTELCERFGISRKTGYKLLRRYREESAAGLLERSRAPHVIPWSIDFKGWFRTGDGARCDPLTITDAFSRFLLCAQLLARPDYGNCRSALERAFKDYGLPGAIRSDNGAPFASVGVGGLSRLSVW